ncbi:hypothetical protein DFH28DRAFT_890059 [Melampsora americana]|nr:hypothetical protein DFH28DRAFT_890059 [Melampsora americana]
MQQHTKKTLREKQAVLKVKYATFERNVKKYNNEFPNADPIPCPSFEEMKRLPFADGFWDIGQLTHPGQPWAVDHATQEGIRALLDLTHARDELHRIGRECRQSINWAVGMEDKLLSLKTAFELMGSKVVIAIQRVKKSKNVLRSLYLRIQQDHARLMIFWNDGMRDLLSKTKRYSQLTEEQENGFCTRWSDLVVRSRLSWTLAAQAEIIEAVPLDEGEAEEQYVDVEDDENDAREEQERIARGDDEVEELEGDEHAESEIGLD